MGRKFGTAVARVNRDEIIQRIANGERVGDIAKSLGVTGAAITQRIGNDPEYKEAIIAGFDKRLDDAEDKITLAEDNVSVSRARAYHQAIGWRAEREAREKYGHQVQVNVSVDIAGALADARARANAIEHDSIVAHTPMLQRTQAIEHDSGQDDDS